MKWEKKELLHDDNDHNVVISVAIRIFNEAYYITISKTLSETQ